MTSLESTAVMASPTPEKLVSLGTRAAVGDLVAPIHGMFALADVGAASAAFSAGTTGKIVVTV